jgi:uncharacterized protein
VKYLRVQNVTRGVELGQRVQVASSLLDRAVGLLLTPSLKPGEGLWISPCKSIHTFFMRYPIDVLFIDQDGKILYQKTYTAWKASGWHARSQGALELSAGTIDRSRSQIGDQITMKDWN